MNNKKREESKEKIGIARRLIASGDEETAREIIEEVAEDFVTDDENMKGYANTLYGACNLLESGEQRKALKHLGGVYRNL